MGPVGVKSTSRHDRLRTGLGGAAGRSRALAGAWAAWVLLLIGWVLVTLGAASQFGAGWALLLAGALLMVFAATLVDVDRGGR